MSRISKAKFYQLHSMATRFAAKLEEAGYSAKAHIVGQWSQTFYGNYLWWDSGRKQKGKRRVKGGEAEL